MNELFQIQPQWARARCLRSNPLAIGVEMPDRPMRAERPFTPLLLLLAIVYLMAVLTPTSASAARLDSAEALAAWAKSKNWTKTSYGIGYKSDKINSFDIWIVYDRTPTLIPFNESWESDGRNPQAVTRTGENITIAGGIPATLLYTSLVHEDSGHESEKWEYYCHDYRVLMRAHRDTQIGQAGSDPLALLENYIAFVNKYLDVKPPKDENCKEDKDCDGIRNCEDLCPNTKGTKALKGCPTREVQDRRFMTKSQYILRKQLKATLKCMGVTNAETMASNLRFELSNTAVPHYLDQNDLMLAPAIPTLFASFNTYAGFVLDEMKFDCNDKPNELARHGLLYHEMMHYVADIANIDNVKGAGVAIHNTWHKSNPGNALDEGRADFIALMMAKLFNRPILSQTRKDYGGQHVGKLKGMTGESTEGALTSFWLDLYSNSDPCSAMKSFLGVHRTYKGYMEKEPQNIKQWVSGYSMDLWNKTNLKNKSSVNAYILSQEKLAAALKKFHIVPNVGVISKISNINGVKNVSYNKTANKKSITLHSNIANKMSVYGPGFHTKINMIDGTVLRVDPLHTEYEVDISNSGVIIVTVTKGSVSIKAPDGQSVTVKQDQSFRWPKTGGSDITDPHDTPPGGGSGGAAQGTARLLTASSNRDMVGRNEKFRGNGKNDAIFRAQFSASNRTVTAVEVSNTNGLRSVWDTRPNNRLWLGGVVIGGRAMNRADGSVNFRLGSSQNTLDFFVEDNGSIRGGKTNYRMTIFFASGDPLVMDIVPANQSIGQQTAGGSVVDVIIPEENSRPWVIGTYNGIHYGTGSAWAEQPGGGRGKDIAIDGYGRPWVIGTDNEIYFHNGNKWVAYPGGGKGFAIDVSADGTPWVIGTYNGIHYGTGSAWAEQPGGGRGKDIAIDDNGRPWVIGSDNGIYYHDGNRWVQYPGGGRGSRIAISPNGTPWVIGTDKGIYYNAGNRWVEQPGGKMIAMDIAIDDNGRPWILDSQKKIYYHNGNSWIEYPGRGLGLAIAISTNKKSNIFNWNSDIPVIAGEWELTCPQAQLYIHNLKLTQSGNKFEGPMICINRSNPNTYVEGQIFPDGSFEFTVSTGSWHQYYKGKIAQKSGIRPILLEGLFGAAKGQEKYEWYAKSLNQSSTNISVAGQWLADQKRPNQTSGGMDGDIIWDFETGSTNGWVTTGTAFNHQPTYGDNPTARRRGQPSKHIGNYWIGTYEKYQGYTFQTPGSIQGDGPKGTLTSNVFTIPSGSLSFLVGGGSSFQTRVELLVSGNRVLHVSGRNTETMQRVKWNLNPWAGQQGQIRLVDNASGGWGHINADDFRFSHSTSPYSEPRKQDSQLR